jgi:hypothetical protein
MPNKKPTSWTQRTGIAGRGDISVDDYHGAVGAFAKRMSGNKEFKGIHGALSNPGGVSASGMKSFAPSVQRFITAGQGFQKSGLGMFKSSSSPKVPKAPKPPKAKMYAEDCYAEGAMACAEAQRCMKHSDWQDELARDLRRSVRNDEYMPHRGGDLLTKYLENHQKMLAGDLRKTFADESQYDRSKHALRAKSAKTGGYMGPGQVLGPAAKSVGRGIAKVAKGVAKSLSSPRSPGAGYGGYGAFADDAPSASKGIGFDPGFSPGTLSMSPSQASQGVTPGFVNPGRAKGGGGPDGGGGGASSPSPWPSMPTRGPSAPPSDIGSSSMGPSGARSPGAAAPGSAAVDAGFFSDSKNGAMACAEAQQKLGKFATTKRKPKNMHPGKLRRGIAKIVRAGKTVAGTVGGGLLGAGLGATMGAGVGLGAGIYNTGRHAVKATGHALGAGLGALETPIAGLVGGAVGGVAGGALGAAGGMGRRNRKRLIRRAASAASNNALGLVSGQR